MKKLSIWWILTIMVALAVVGWYISTVMEEPLVLALCSVVSIVAAGYVLTKEDKKRIQEYEKLISVVNQISKNVKEDVSALADVTNQSFESNQKYLKNEFEILKRNVTAAAANIRNEMDKNETARQQDSKNICKALDSVGESFINATEAYQNMEERMAALEQQNIHLQHLTTLIGTVRSDIATINEVKGFAQEQKEGRKIRIVRDDENKIVIENLMNNDGVRIEKSKMFRNKRLVFEADFNATGKMITSRSYDKDENLETEVTYAVDDQGKPSLRAIGEKLVGILKSIKR